MLPGEPLPLVAAQSQAVGRERLLDLLDRLLAEVRDRAELGLALRHEVAEAPDTTTQKTMHDDPTKLDQSGEPSREKTRGEGAGSKGKKGGKS